MKKIYKISLLLTMLIGSGAAYGLSPTEPKKGMSGEDLFMMLILGLLVVGMLLIAFTIFQIHSIISRMLNPNTATDLAYDKAMENRTFWQKIAGLRPMQFEKNYMMEHTYDGIAEIDNPIPGWFMYLFYATIVFAGVYWVAYHVVGDGQVMTNEYKQQMDEGDKVRETYMKKFANSVNEDNVVALKDDKGIEAGKKIFIQNCVACHAPDGGGGVGPNLTDEFWLHGGGVKAIFHTISEGVPEKGMISWKKTLNPIQIQQVESFIISLKGTKPAAPKEPQGVKDEPTATSATSATDSTKAAPAK